MVPIMRPTTKRTFEQTGPEEDQDETDISTSGTRHKHVRFMEDDNTDAHKASLDSLPTEIIVLIASYLSTSELLSLRLTNRTIESQLFNDFAGYYFAKKQFMLTAQSLQCLLDISLHPKLRTVLKHVIISLDRFELDQSERLFRPSGEDTAFARATRYRQGAYDQAALLATGQDRELLTQALRNLPNLKTVGLRDYNNNHRPRDGNGAEWRAYGATTVMNETGRRLLVHEARRNYYTNRPQYPWPGGAVAFAARAFTVVLQALGDSEARPENLEILLRDMDNGIPDHAFHIPKFLEPTVAPPLARLKSMILTVYLSRITIFKTDSSGQTLPNMPTYALESFLRLVPNLTHLRLNFQREQTGNAEWFLERLANTDPNLATQILPKLAQLDIGMMRGPSVYLLQSVVRRFGGTLRGVSFWRVEVADSVAQKTQVRLDKHAKPNRWAELLLQLPKLAPGLDHVSVGCLTQCCRDELQSVVIRGDEPQRHLARGVYTKEDMSDATRFKTMLEEELVVQWPEMWTELESDDGHGGLDTDSEGNTEDVDEGEEEE